MSQSVSVFFTALIALCAGQIVDVTPWNWTDTNNSPAGLSPLAVYPSLAQRQRAISVGYLGYVNRIIITKNGKNHTSIFTAQILYVIDLSAVTAVYVGAWNATSKHLSVFGANFVHSLKVVSNDTLTVLDLFGSNHHFPLSTLTPTCQWKSTQSPTTTLPATTCPSKGQLYPMVDVHSTETFPVWDNNGQPSLQLQCDTQSVALMMYGAYMTFTGKVAFRSGTPPLQLWQGAVSVQSTLDGVHYNNVCPEDDLQLYTYQKLRLSASLIDPAVLKTTEAVTCTFGDIFSNKHFHTQLSTNGKLSYIQVVDNVSLNGNKGHFKIECSSSMPKHQICEMGVAPCLSSVSVEYTKLEKPSEVHDMDLQVLFNFVTVTVDTVTEKEKPSQSEAQEGKEEEQEQESTALNNKVVSVYFKKMSGLFNNDMDGTDVDEAAVATTTHRTTSPSMSPNTPSSSSPSSSPSNTAPSTAPGAPSWITPSSNFPSIQPVPPPSPQIPIWSPGRLSPQPPSHYTPMPDAPSSVETNVTSNGLGLGMTTWSFIEKSGCAKHQHGVIIYSSTINIDNLQISYRTFNIPTNKLVCLNQPPTHNYTDIQFIISPKSTITTPAATQWKCTARCTTQCGDSATSLIDIDVQHKSGEVQCGWTNAQWASSSPSSGPWHLQGPALVAVDSITGLVDPKNQLPFSNFFFEQSTAKGLTADGSIFDLSPLQNWSLPQHYTVEIANTVFNYETFNAHGARSISIPISNTRTVAHSTNSKNQTVAHQLEFELINLLVNSSAGPELAEFSSMKVYKDKGWALPQIAKKKTYQWDITAFWPHFPPHHEIRLQAQAPNGIGFINRYVPLKCEKSDQPKPSNTGSSTFTVRCILQHLDTALDQLVQAQTIGWEKNGGSETSSYGIQLSIDTTTLPALNSAQHLTTHTISVYMADSAFCCTTLVITGAVVGGISVAALIVLGVIIATKRSRQRARNAGKLLVG